MRHAISMGRKIAEARKLASPPLSRKNLSDRLRKSGLDISPGQVTELETGKLTLNYYQVNVLAGALGTTAEKLLS